MGDTLVLRSRSAVRGSSAVRGRTVVPVGIVARSAGAFIRPATLITSAAGITTRPVGATGGLPERRVPARTAMPGHVSGHPSGAASTSAHAGPRGRLTLTRRGRLLFVGLPVAAGIMLLITVGAFLTSEAQAGDGPAQSSPTISVTVGAGETLWGLASHHVPDRDTRDVVAEMVELNNLRSSVVQAGQSVSIPVQR